MSVRIDTGKTSLNDFSLFGSGGNSGASFYGNGSNVSTSYSSPTEGLANTLNDILVQTTNGSDGSNTFWSALGDFANKLVTTGWDDWTGNTANRENIAYQKEYNEQVFKRADTQFQRTVADLRAAGLSSQLSAGAPSTVAGQSSAPQRTVGNESQAMERLISMISSMKQVNANAELASAQVDKTKAETASIEAQNATYSERHALEMILRQSEANYNNVMSRIALYESPYKVSEINARIDNLKTDNAYKNSLISLAEKQGSLYEAQTLESSAKTSLYNAQTIESGKRSENLDADTALKYASKDEIRQRIINLKQEKENLVQDFALKVKQGLHLDAQTELLLKQAINADLDYKINLYNFDTSYRNGLRTTDDMPKSLLGLSGIAYQFGNYLNNAIQNFK